MTDKIKACFLLGACGDALGAPLEGLRKIEDIVQRYGEQGLSDIIEFKNAYELGLDYPAGRITDDTTMAMTSCAALILACQKQSPQEPGFQDTLHHFLWQGYLNWAQFQDSSLSLSDKIDTSIAWPDLAKDFWFPCGAGRGTLAALSQDKPGSVEHPLDYACTIKGKEIKGPNRGCGGMMRVAPLAFIPQLSPDKIFECACESAALTHSDQTAFVATGITALYIHYAVQDLPPSQILQKTEDLLAHYLSNPSYQKGAEECLTAIRHARLCAHQKPNDMMAIENMPRDLGYKNPFLAAPVLAQTTYAIACAEQYDEDMTAAKIKMLVSLSVNHSGDSDSVGAIVGNILGARYGSTVIPQDWLNILLQRTQIEAMAQQLSQTLTPSAAYKTAPKGPTIS